MPDPVDERAIYSIGAVARMLGVPVATLRSWEERYEIVQPRRSAGGQRLYTREELEHLRFVQAQVESGMSPADAHRLLSERLGAADQPVAAGDRSHRLLILLAEHDPYAAELAEYFLRTEGYDVAVSLDAADAEDAFERLEPDIAVIEWLISGGVGGEVCRRLKDLSDVPVVVLSNIALQDVALEAGADAFIQKPLEPLALISTIKDLLGDSALTRGGRAAVPV